MSKAKLAPVLSASCGRTTLRLEYVGLYCNGGVYWEDYRVCSNRSIASAPSTRTLRRLSYRYLGKRCKRNWHVPATEYMVPYHFERGTTLEQRNAFLGAFVTRVKAAAGGTD